MRVLVRDLDTGDRVAGVSFRWRQEDAPAAGRSWETAISDEHGYLALPGGSRQTLFTDDPVWQAVPTTLDEAVREKETWVHRELTVRGTVRPAGPGTLAYTTVRISAQIAGPPQATVLDPGEEPWSARWARRRGLPRAWRDFSIDGAGRFELKAPASKWLAVMVQAVGWRTAIVDVPRAPTAEGGGGSVDIALMPATRVAGSLRSRSGGPLVGGTVRLRTRRELPGSEHLARYLLTGEAFGTVTSAEASYMEFEEEVRTDSEGNFLVYAGHEGELELVVHAQGHAPVLVRLGRQDRDWSDLQLVADLPESPMRPVLLRSGEQRFASGRVALVDITDRQRQRGVEIELDPGSRIPNTWLVEGHEYWLAVTPKEAAEGAGRPTGLLRWDGRDEIDLSQLPKLLDDFR